MPRPIHPLTRAHLSLGLDQNEFAKKIGVHVGTVINWKKGRAIPQTEHIQLMAKLLKKSGGEVLEMISPSETATTGKGA